MSCTKSIAAMSLRCSRRRLLAALAGCAAFLAGCTAGYGQWLADQRPPPGSVKFNIGDHIYITRGNFDHHGLVWATDGSGAGRITKVAHISSGLLMTQDGGDAAGADVGDPSRNSFRVAGVEYFLQGAEYAAIKRMHYGTAWKEAVMGYHSSPLFADAPAVTIARAKWLLRHRDLGVGRYDLLGQNCEHAAHWCRTGQQWSRQSLMLQRDQVPFAAEVDDSLLNHVAWLRKNSWTALPRRGDVVQLQWQGYAVEVDLQDANGGCQFVRSHLRSGAKFRVHSTFAEATGDPRPHLVLGFEYIGHGCFLGEAKGRLVCSSRSFDKGEHFLPHATGSLQHWQTGGYIAANGNLEEGRQLAVLSDESFAAEFRWPPLVTHRWWYESSIVATVALVAALLLLARWAWRRSSLLSVEPLLHAALLVLLTATCVSFWINGEVAAFCTVFLACFFSVPVGYVKSAPWQLLNGLAVVCSLAFAAYSILGAKVHEEPLLTAAAQAIMGMLLVWLLFDLKLTLAAVWIGSPTVVPSRAAAIVAVPALLTCILVGLATGRAVPVLATTLRWAAVAVGSARLAWVGFTGPRARLPASQTTAQPKYSVSVVRQQQPEEAQNSSAAPALGVPTA
eukprot:TRINITY_DN26631_c0_g1_i1.p1 TRINITY_DN26631_c0_g1~~TRINITY_DN26631_c0_g1_i1.p1  ORF type:complete len:619 (-),score=79.12 TRINITY_DN26631_c0_g1_i1:464-2320(-)